MFAKGEHEERAREAIRRALTTVPFYVKQGLAARIDGSNGVAADAPVNELLRHLPLLTRDRVRPTLPKQWFPEGRDAKAELAAGKVSVVEVGTGNGRVRVLFDPHAYVAQQKRALGVEGAWRDAVLWVPERGTGSCGAGDPGYEDRLEGSRLHVNSRQDPAFWTERVMTRMLDELTQHETTALLADPFYLDVLARHAAILGRRLDVRDFIVLTRARPTLAQRAQLARVYQGKVIDLLAAREVGTLFVSGADNLMHHTSFATHVEMLPAKVATPGASNVALLAVTTLERDVQPLVRYVLGDLVQVAGPTSITTVEGSVDDAIVRPDGAIVTSGAIDRAIGPDPRAYQVTQNAPDAVEIEVVGGDVNAAQERVAPLFEGMHVMARAVTAIGVEPNGKYRTTRRSNVPLAIEAAFAAGAVS
jgi:phenylacetate-coenzyme A ligase PaaK-like adenylate-forming protein